MRWGHRRVTRESKAVAPNGSVATPHVVGTGIHLPSTDSTEHKPLSHKHGEKGEQRGFIRK